MQTTIIQKEYGSLINTRDNIDKKYKKNSMDFSEEQNNIFSSLIGPKYIHKEMGLIILFLKQQMW